MHRRVGSPGRKPSGTRAGFPENVVSTAGAFYIPPGLEQGDPLGESFDLSGLLDEYRDESRTQLDQLDAALLKLERGDALPEPERIALLRALHTLKGNSGMLGFAAVRDHVHGIEAIFRSPPPSWSPELLDRLFRGAAALRQAVEAAGTAREAVAFERLATLGAPSLPFPAPPAATPAAPVAASDTPSEGARVEPDEELPPRPEAEELGVASGTEVLRIPFTKLDALLNQVGELFRVQSALAELVSSHRGVLEAAGLRGVLEERNQQLERVVDALRASAMDLRLVPVGRVFGRFPSLVRDLARTQKKKVRVVLEGEETRLDKSTVDALAEPLLHLVRNAVDHGIQLPATRKAAGKPQEGTIALRAAQSGGNVRIEVEDDGVGLDRARILEQARSLGLVTAGEEPSAAEVAELIFRPGFSTRRQADTLSGRGIGLDVVASRVAALRGTLEVEDAPGAATRFILHLPLTLAIVPALLFEAAGETLALPALEVEDALRPAGVSWAAGAEVVPYGDELVPLARPARLFGWRQAGDAEADAPHPPRFVVVVRRGTHAAGVAADRLLDQRDVVVKALPDYLGQPRGVFGATIAPDGRVIWLLDAGALIDLNLNSHRRRGSGPASP